MLKYDKITIIANLLLAIILLFTNFTLSSITKGTISCNNNFYQLHKQIQYDNFRLKDLETSETEDTKRIYHRQKTDSNIFSFFPIKHSLI